MHRPTVRSHLVKLVLACMLPAALAAVVTIHYVHEQKQQQFESSLAEATRALALAVDQEIGRRETVVRTLAQSPMLTAGDLRGFYEFVRVIAPDVRTVVTLATLDRQQVLNTRRPFGDPGLPRTVFGYADVQRARGGTLVSDVYWAPIGQQYSFAVTVPVVRDGQPRYLLSYAGYVSALQKLFEDQRLPPGWVASVVDGKGVVVARNRDAGKYVGRPASEQLRSRIGSTPQGFYEARTLDGTRTRSFFSTARDHGWTVVIGVPATQAGSPWAAAGAFAALSAVLLLAALWGAAWLGRALVRPVVQVRDAAERIARAEPVEMAPTGLAETDTVMQVLADTSASVRTASQQMQARVDEALAEADRAHQVVLQNQRLEALGQLTGGVAHDFNNLLMVVSNYTHLLRARNPALAGAQEVAGIERAVSTGSKLTRQLLAFARRQPVRPELLDLRTRLPEIAGLLKASLGSRIVLTCEVAPDTLPVRVDPAEFELALINLAVNARDAMPDGGRLEVSAANADGGQVCITVADSGKGIPADLLQKVFEPFFTTKAVGHGTGLGLSQVYGLAKQAGGDARIESTEGSGTRVSLCLPGVRDATAAAEADDAAAVALVGGNQAVLMVEDNAELAGVTAQVLEAAGFRVTRAGNGDAARGLLEDGACFDVVLSDVRMPGSMDGIALAGWLRSHRPGVPLVLMTGYSAELAQARALGLQVLPKPSPPAALVEALLRELRAAEAAD